MLGSLCSVALVVSDSTTLLTVDCQAPLSIGFSRQEYWRRFPCTSPAVFLMLGSGEMLFMEIPLFFVGEDSGNPLQYSYLENPVDRGTWWAAVHGVAKSRTRLSDFTFTFHFHPLEKEMATHSSVLAWRIPGTVEPGGLPSMGSHRVGHD